jgi:hypothetical protein
MPFTLRFSDASKIETVYVPDMPPGVNNIDTSLSLAGKGYPNYAEKIAENFLKLLENFASPIPPSNPIEGQLWYDTSDQNKKVLRIMDGTADNVRWPSATGIYQQGTDPRESPISGLKVGDIWVDTSKNQLKIYNSNAWTLIGPLTSSGVSKTGVEPDEIEDTTGNNKFVIKSYINGEIVSIIANETFTPRIVIEGFNILRPGINISNKNSAIVNGIADTARFLEIAGRKYSSDRFLRKDDSSNLGQIITGKVFFQTPENQTNYLGRDGVLINSALNSEFIQLHKLANDGVLLNNTPGGKLIFKTRSDQISGLVSGLTIDNRSVSINTVTDSNYALSINGNLKVSGNFDLQSTATVQNFVVSNNLSVNNSLYVQNQTTITGILTLGTTSSNGVILTPGNHVSYDIGSPSNYFRNLYVSYIGAIGTGTVVHGNITGFSNGLSKSSQFLLTGQVSSNSFNFNGTGTSATFVTSLTENAITDQSEISTSTSTLTLLVVDVSTTTSYPGLRKINRENFLKDIVPSGSIISYGTSTPPVGWLLCDGSSKSTVDYAQLFNVIGYIYGGVGPSFNVPDMRASTTSTIGYINYIIKI